MFSSSLLVRDVTRDIGGVFTDWERNPSRWVFISGKGVVSDGKAGENSPFAASILKHLEQNDSDALNIVRLADRVTQEIRFNYEQQAEISPLFQAGHGGGQFLFVKRQTERDDWNSALQQNTEGGYLVYLKKYPEGQYTNVAEENLKEIADENQWRIAAVHDAAFAYRQYLKKHPNGKYVKEAQNILDNIEQSAALLKQEEERIEQERLEKLEADRKKIELEHLEKLKKEQIELQRQAEIARQQEEADENNLWLECLAKLNPLIYLQKYPSGKFALQAFNLKLDLEEKEKQARIDAERKRQAELKRQQAETIEYNFWLECLDKQTPSVYLQKYPSGKFEEEAFNLKLDIEEKEKQEREKKKRERVAQTIEYQQITKKEMPSIFQKYKYLIIIGSILVISLLIMQLAKTHGRPKASLVAEPIEKVLPQQEKVNNTTPTIAQNGKTTTVKFNEMSHDWGSINEGDKMTHIFKFTNTGKTDLIISDARGSCGCTVPEWPKDPISPGKTSEIKVIFDSAHKSGQQNKTVTITANTEPISLVLIIKGTVEPKGEKTN